MSATVTITVPRSDAAALLDDSLIATDFPAFAAALKAAGLKSASEAEGDAAARRKHLSKSTAGRKVLHILDSHLDEHGEYDDETGNVVPPSNASALFKSLHAYVSGASDGEYASKNGSVAFPV